MSWRGLALVGVAGILALASGVEARRMVRVTPKCFGGAAEPAVDRDGEKDACVSQAAVRCAEQDSLEVDRHGEEDRCVTPGSSAEKKPACSGAHRWVPQMGADTCLLVATPTCPGGYRLRHQPADDVCVY